MDVTISDVTNEGELQRPRSQEKFRSRPVCESPIREAEVEETLAPVTIELTVHMPQCKFRPPKLDTTMPDVEEEDFAPGISMMFAANKLTSPNKNALESQNQIKPKGDAAILVDESFRGLENIVLTETPDSKQKINGPIVQDEQLKKTRNLIISAQTTE
jgi:hypothetical protein